MKATAELDYVGGKPMLRMEQQSSDFDYSGKRNVFDIPLTPEQVRIIKVRSDN